jgi:hypothetical protein
MSISRPISRPISRSISRGINVQRKAGDSTPVVYWNIVDDLQPEIYFDFGNNSTITKTGDLIDAVANLGSLGATGNWTSATTGRPDHDATYGAAVFGSGEYLGAADIAGFNTSGSLSVFIVFERRNDSGATEAMFNQYRTSNNTRSFLIGFNSSDQILVGASTAGTADNTTLTLTSAAIELYDINLLTWIYDPTNNLQTLRLNGNTAYQTTTTAGAGLFNSSASIGINLVNNAATGNFQGAIYALAGYNSALSDANRDLAEGYLANLIDTRTAAYVETPP